MTPGDPVEALGQGDLHARMDWPDELARLARAGRLDRSVASRAGAEAAGELLADRGDDRVGVVDAWLARARADQSGHSTDQPASLPPVRSPSARCPSRCAPAPRCSPPSLVPAPRSTPRASVSPPSGGGHGAAET
ncbi:hypothetical protein [Streptomyces exfoliatus]|uniref:hypothetical protein n=1 Tax=Streptomyces exfoliatus TaxID=1905 RepID=UPI0012FEF687|nr:hypothetical protein [Streptomyces exfoliatus]